MKKTIFTILLAGLAVLAFSQEYDTSLKKDIFSVDIGFFGAWVNYERHLDGLFTLNTELGLDGGFGVDFMHGEYVAFAPTIRVEPRYYYSFNRRVRLGKKTSYNASSYIAFTSLYLSNLFTISNVSGLEAATGLYLIPKWGIKRTIGQRLNFEFALGIGAGPFFGKDKIEATAGIDLRFGYNF